MLFEFFKVLEKQQQQQLTQMANLQKQIQQQGGAQANVQEFQKEMDNMRKELQSSNVERERLQAQLEMLVQELERSQVRLLKPIGIPITLLLTASFFILMVFLIHHSSLISTKLTSDYKVHKKKMSQMTLNVTNKLKRK